MASAEHARGPGLHAGSPPGPAAAAGVPRRSHARAAAVIIAGVAIVQVLLVLMFSWAASRSAPRGVPIGVAGPARAVSALAAGLAHGAPGAFAVTALSGDAAARHSVTGRAQYAAISLGPGSATVYLAGAAAPGLEQRLATLLPQALKHGAPGMHVTVTDLVPNPAHDPDGAGLPLSLIPIAVTSIAAGSLMALRLRSRWPRLAGLAGYAITAGLLGALALQTVLGVLTGSWLANAAILALGTLAIAAGAAGLVSILGAAGAVVTVLVVFFYGFAFSGVMSAWQLLPSPWGHLAQYLPVASLATAARAVAFFSGAGAGGRIVTLAVWAALGMAASLVVRNGSRASVSTR